MGQNVTIWRGIIQSWTDQLTVIPEHHSDQSDKFLVVHVQSVNRFKQLWDLKQKKMGEKDIRECWHFSESRKEHSRNVLGTSFALFDGKEPIEMAHIGVMVGGEHESEGPKHPKVTIGPGGPRLCVAFGKSPRRNVRPFHDDKRTKETAQKGPF